MLDDAPDEIAFEGQVIEWRGPAPFYFARISAEDARALLLAARRASYGWGCVPMAATIGVVEFRTSLFPKDGGFLLPLKATVRQVLAVVPGDRVEAVVRIVPSRRTGRRG
ncbi:hypothetical protein ASG11_05170 [Sphingomonas sp. Leaf357]|uniref:DUF1905 domain-containing protein n=1 Tax=Sphingomonas sp. Leaf357 TaxID=1736350 RepID=UPI0006F3EE73|nr:DUF1905 domain-containing protein [Sphingomonas sp. Leaf357]KQS05183.1 hypothetical protein ASG11_05170 [Sphingomonas sp. Leaf357]